MPDIGRLSVACLSLCLFLWAGLAGAQTDPDAPSLSPIAPPATTETTVSGAVPAYDDPQWEGLATRAENALQARRASNFALSIMREDLVRWRAQFLEMQSVNAGRIRTLQSQISALGPAPEEGASEPERIAAERQRLNDRLADLRVPVQLAAEAHAQADRLIAEVDALVRQRSVEEVTARVTSPLNPGGWMAAYDGMSAGVRAIWTEVRGQWDNPIRRQQFWDSLAGSIFLGVLGVILTLRGRFWVDWLVRRVGANTRRGRGVVEFVLSLGNIILPLGGVYLISLALQTTGLLGPRGDSIVEGLPSIAVYIIVSRWLMTMLFTPREGNRGNPLDMEPRTAAKARRIFVWLAWVLSAGVMIRLLVATTDVNDVSRGVLMFPILAIAAVLLWRFGKTLRKYEAPEEEEDTTTRPYRYFLAALVGRGLWVVGVGGLLLGILGFARAFELLIYSTTATLVLLGTLTLLQALVFDVYALLTRSEEGARDALVPVLIGFTLSFLAMPLLALIWGARVSDLSELYTRFSEGFQMGATRISPTDFLTFVVVFVMGYTATRLLQGALRTTVLPKTKLDTGGQTAVVSGLGYVGLFLAGLIAITTAGIDLSGLAIVAGALSVGIGFGLQTIVSNFVSGIILLIERPISQGDWIEVGGQMGFVRDISVRSTRIETFDRTDVIIPNADLVSGTVTNFTRGNTVGRVIVAVGVAYGTDTRKVEAILREVAEAHPLVLLQPPPGVLFMGFGADSLEFEIRAILRDVNWVLSVKSEMNHDIARRFAEEGIEIPFAQRDIWLRNPEVLTGGAPSPAAPVASEGTPAPVKRDPAAAAHLEESDMGVDAPDGDGR